MRALRDGSGRALKIGQRARVTDCAECCVETEGNWFYLACPCANFEFRPCAVVDGPCVYIDARTLLDDSPLPIGEREDDGIFATWNPFGFWDIYTVIRVDGVCYSLLSALRFSNDAGFGIPMPDGAVTVGGSGVTYDRREDCTGGCDPQTPGADAWELFPCDGCRGPIAGRKFVCAKTVIGVNVVSIGSFESGSWCVSRGISYTQAQALALGSIISVNPVLIAADVGGKAGRIPAPSCCFGVPIPQCAGTCRPTCMRGFTWRNFPGLGWVQVDSCCGRKDGFTYTVNLSYTRVTTFPPRESDGFVLVLTETGSIVSVAQDPTDCEFVNVTVSQIISYNDGNGSTDQFVVRAAKQCCLDVPEGAFFPGGFSNKTFVPLPYVYQNNGTVVDGFSYNDRGPWYGIADPNDNLRQSWFESGWGEFFQIAGPQSESLSYGAGGSATVGCNQSNFTFTESQTWSDGRQQQTDVSLSINTVTSPAFPCAPSGSCGPGGFAFADIGGFFL